MPLLHVAALPALQQCQPLLAIFKNTVYTGEYKKAEFTGMVWWLSGPGCSRQDVGSGRDAAQSSCHLSRPGSRSKRDRAQWFLQGDTVTQAAHNKTVPGPV